MCKDREDPAFLALAGYWFFWLTFDGPTLKKMEGKGGKLTGDLARKISVRYSTHRTFRKSSANKNEKWDAIAGAITALSQEMTGSLTDKAERCRACAEELGANTSAIPYSGVTKLVWFLKPERWTIYDRFVANALAPPGTYGAERFSKFYQALEPSFDRVTEAIAEPVHAVEESIRPERVIDSFLMLAGGPEERREEVRLKVACLPKLLRTRMDEASEEIARHLAAAPWKLAKQNA